MWHRLNKNAGFNKLKNLSRMPRLSTTQHHAPMQPEKSKYLFGPGGWVKGGRGRSSLRRHYLLDQVASFTACWDLNI